MKEIKSPTEIKVDAIDVLWDRMERRRILREQMGLCLTYWDHPDYSASAKKQFFELAKRHAALCD